MSIGLCDVCTVNAVCGRLDVNVALNRPTFMSSVYYKPQYGVYDWPSKANDGNRDPAVDKVDSSCFQSVADFSNNWWAVDLGVPLSVVGVLFTNAVAPWGNVHVYRATDLGFCEEQTLDE